METDEAYYARRAIEERGAAERATDALAREVHLVLAEAYEGRSAAARLSPAEKRGAPLTGTAKGLSRKPGTVAIISRVTPMQ